jgi:hypothetical protein
MITLQVMMILSFVAFGIWWGRRLIAEEEFEDQP